MRIIVVCLSLALLCTAIVYDAAAAGLGVYGSVGGGRADWSPENTANFKKTTGHLDFGFAMDTAPDPAEDTLSVPLRSTDTSLLTALLKDQKGIEVRIRKMDYVDNRRLLSLPCCAPPSCYARAGLGVYGSVAGAGRTGRRRIQRTLRRPPATWISAWRWIPPRPATSCTITT